MEMTEMEFYKMAYQGLDELAQKVTEAKDYAAIRYNRMVAEAQAPQQPVVQPEPVKEEKTPTAKKEK